MKAQDEQQAEWQKKHLSLEQALQEQKSRSIAAAKAHDEALRVEQEQVEQARKLAAQNEAKCRDLSEELRRETRARRDAEKLFGSPRSQAKQVRQSSGGHRGRTQVQKTREVQSRPQGSPLPDDPAKRVPKLFSRLHDEVRVLLIIVADRNLLTPHMLFLLRTYCFCFPYFACSLKARALRDRRRAAQERKRHVDQVKYTGVPKVGTRPPSSTSEASPGNTASIHSRLYRDGMSRVARRKELARSTPPGCSFRPKIRSRSPTRSPPVPDCDNDTGDDTCADTATPTKDAKDTSTHCDRDEQRTPPHPPTSSNASGKSRDSVFGRLHAAALEQQRAQRQAHDRAQAEEQLQLEKRRKAMLGNSLSPEALQPTNNVFGRLHMAAKMQSDRRTELCEQVAEKAGVSTLVITLLHCHVINPCCCHRLSTYLPLMQCTFAPKLLSTSAGVANDVTSTQPVHERLYQRHVIQMAEQEAAAAARAQSVENVEAKIQKQSEASVPQQPHTASTGAGTAQDVTITATTVMHTVTDIETETENDADTDANGGKPENDNDNKATRHSYVT